MLGTLAWWVERESGSGSWALRRCFCAVVLGAPLILLGAAGCALPTTIGMVPSDESSSSAEDQGTTSLGTTTGDSASMTASSSTDPTSSSSTSSSTSVASNTGSSSSSDGPREVTAFAIRFGDIPESGSTGGTTFNSEVGSGDGPDDDALLVKVTTSFDSCEEPSATDPCNSWAVSFVLAPDQQTPGTYDLLDDVNALGVESGADDTSGMCSFGGGTLEGTVVIESISADEVVGRFETAETLLDVDVNFSFVAPRC